MTDDLDLDALADVLSDFAAPEKKIGRGPREERIIAGFEEVQRFVEKHGHAPRHGESRDIFERIYATRLDRLRAQEDCRTLLEPLDHQGLLAGAETQPSAPDDDMDTDALLAELEDAIGSSDISDLRYVRTAEEKRAAEEIANREKCDDFETFNRDVLHKIGVTGGDVAKRIANAKLDATFLLADVETRTQIRWSAHTRNVCARSKRRRSK